MDLSILLTFHTRHVTSLASAHAERTASVQARRILFEVTKAPHLMPLSGLTRSLRMTYGVPTSSLRDSYWRSARFLRGVYAVLAYRYVVLLGIQRCSTAATRPCGADGYLQSRQWVLSLKPSLDQKRLDALQTPMDGSISWVDKIYASTCLN